jgi:hypothetical protein
MEKDRPTAEEREEMVPLDRVRTAGMQMRAARDPALVAEYRAAYEAKGPAALGRLKAVKDPEGWYWTWDGNHRYEAGCEAQVRALPGDVRDGTAEDAAWLATSANKEHGLKRTNEDKRKAVEAALKMRPEMSNVAIADHCGVSDTTVADARGRLESSSVIPEMRERIVERGGKTYTQKTANRKAAAGPKSKPAASAPSLRQRLAEAGVPDDAVTEEDGVTYIDVADGDDGVIRQQPAEEWLRANVAEAAGKKPADAPARTPEPPVVDDLPRDGLGIVIPEGIREAFAALPEFHAIVKELHAIHARIRALAAGPGGEQLMDDCEKRSKDGGATFYAESQHMKALVHQVRSRAPFASVAPDYYRTPWMTESQWKQTPEADRLALKAQALAEGRLA